MIFYLTNSYCLKGMILEERKKKLRSFCDQLATSSSKIQTKLSLKSYWLSALDLYGRIKQVVLKETVLRGRSVLTFCLKLKKAIANLAN